MPEVDLVVIAPDAIKSLAGFQLDRFSVVVDDLAFLVGQQTTLTWPNDDYYQVQHAYRFNTLCDGGPNCKVVPGTYLAINQTTGQRELLDIPYVKPSDQAEAIALEDTEFQLNDGLLEALSVNVKRTQYACENGGDMTMEYTDQQLDEHLSPFIGIERTGYVFNQCSLTLRDSLLPDGEYEINGSMHADIRMYGGYLQQGWRYDYSEFSLLGDNGVEYFIDGNTKHYEFNSRTFRRRSTINEYRKHLPGGQLEESISDSSYDWAITRAVGSEYWRYRQDNAQFSGTWQSPISNQQTITTLTTSPLTQDWHHPSYTFDYPAIPFQGSFQMTAQDGSVLSGSANPCVVEDGDSHCAEAMYVDYLAVDANGMQTEAVDIWNREHEESIYYHEKAGPYCTPYGDVARVQGRLECETSVSSQEDIYGRYSSDQQYDHNMEFVLP